LRREQWWPSGDWDGRPRRCARRVSAFQEKGRADAGAAWKIGCGTDSRQEDGRDRGGVALPSPAAPPSSPTAPSSSITKFAPGSSILSPPSPDLRPRGQRRGGRSRRRATARDAEDIPPPAFSSSSFSISLSLSRDWERGREEGVGPACRRTRPWICRQNGGSARRRCPYTFFRCRDTTTSVFVYTPSVQVSYAYNCVTQR
jgi:hypothetical protein